MQSQGEGESERSSSPPPTSSAGAMITVDMGANSELQVVELQKQLREKDLVLTDIRLEALSSAHQLESLKDTVMKMRVNNSFIKNMSDISKNNRQPDNNSQKHIIVQGIMENY